MLGIRYHKNFKKSYGKLPLKIQKVADDRLLLFARHPFAELLHNHPLKGKYIGCRSINVTGDYRILHSDESEYEVLLLDIGTHSQLYK